MLYYTQLRKLDAEVCVSEVFSSACWQPKVVAKWKSCWCSSGTFPGWKEHHLCRKRLPYHRSSVHIGACLHLLFVHQANETDICQASLDEHSVLGDGIAVRRHLAGQHTAQLNVVISKGAKPMWGTFLSAQECIKRCCKIYISVLVLVHIRKAEGHGKMRKLKVVNHREQSLNGSMAGSRSV